MPPRHIAEPAEETARASGSQTLTRALDILEAVADGTTSLAALSTALGLSRSTTYRLAAALAERRYLAATPRGGFALGIKCLELGAIARDGLDLVRAARPFIEELAALTSDTVHLGVLDGDQALYLDKLAGTRRITVSSRVGERQPLSTTGLGKALMLDDAPHRWAAVYAAEHAGTDGLEPWIERMRGYAAAGHAFDLEENADRVRCVAAPVRAIGGEIVAAISVSCARQYMDDDRMAAVSDMVRSTAHAISATLGWRGTARCR